MTAKITADFKPSTERGAWEWRIYIIRQVDNAFRLYETDGITQYWLSEHNTFNQAAKQAQKYARLAERMEEHNDDIQTG